MQTNTLMFELHWKFNQHNKYFSTSTPLFNGNRTVDCIKD